MSIIGVIARSEGRSNSHVRKNPRKIANTNAEVQLIAPCRSYPHGLIAEGFYRVEGGTVVLVTKTGAQRYDTKDKPRHKLQPGETARGIAWRLTKDHTPKRRSDFNRQIPHFNPGKI